MNINRRKFIGSSSLAVIGAAVFRPAGLAAILKPAEGSAEWTRLKDNFLNPPAATKAGCYWWWFNGLLNKEGITRDLEEFKKQGIGTVLLINTKGGLQGVDMPQGAKMLSPEWRELNRHAMQEASRLNIEVGVNLSSGWCMGGPWITPEHSGRWLLQSRLTVTGPQRFSGELPLPGNRDGYDNVFNPPGFKNYIDLPLSQLDYRDTAIVAVPDHEGAYFSAERAGEVLSAKTNRKDASSHAKVADVLAPTLVRWKNLDTDNPVPVNQVIDLTQNFTPDGKLVWDVPPGKWTIIRTGHRMTGSKLLIAQPEVNGLSVDWFAKEGVDLQFENLGKIFLEDVKGLRNNPLKFFHDDSFEDGFPNWTEKILEQFKNYRGYDPTPYLPVFAGMIIGSAEVSDRFLHDYRKTVADCMADMHYKHFADLCHKNGLLVQNEAAGPSRSGSICMDGLKNLGRSDHPMGEFWLGPKHDEEGGLSDALPYGKTRLENGQNKVTKMAASAAHIYGKKTVSAEAFTSHRHWLDYPSSLKQALDRAFCEGVNRIFIHTSTATRPEDGKPGYEYGAGTHFNPNVTWWDKSSGFLDYVGRSQNLLRQGLFVADVLYYNGDWAPNIVEPKHADPSLGKGYDYDVCNEEVLLTRVSCKNGKLILPDGMSYRILVLPESDRMSLEVIRKLKELVKQGACISGPKPVQVSGLRDFPQCDTELKNIGDQLWGKIDGKNIKLNNFGAGRVFFGETIKNILTADGVLPDFVCARDAENAIDFIHRSTPAAELYFIANKYKEPVKSTCSFRIKGRYPEIWDPVSGKINAKVAFEMKNDRIDIPLSFDAFQSYFIVFPKVQSAGAGKAKANHLVLEPLKELAGSWTVEFDPEWGGPSSIEFPVLQDWSKHPDERVKYYSGKALYHKTFRTDSLDKRLFLDLGLVSGIADVTLNGKKLGIVWTAPWQIDLSPAVKKGVNKLEIEVINLWPNRLIGDAALPPEKRLTHTNIIFKSSDKLLPSGLMGPVIIKSEL